ncbi:hypothetical protein AADH40_02345 [Rickettsia rickettsii]|nr:hypothetical protein [Rickettsia rickettsii]
MNSVGKIRFSFRSL